ncbi:MAG: lipopolysaccharide biosynthesis protein [Egibacteraceae bacterium]
MGRTIARGTAWSGISRFGVLGFGFIGQALTARLLAPADFGSYTLILSIAGSVALVAQLGLPQSTVRHIARANAAAGGSRARPALATAAAAALVAAGAASALVLLPLAGLIDRAFPAVGVKAVLGLFAALAGIRILENIAPELFRGVHDFRNGSIFGGFLSAVLLAAFTAVALARADTASLETALAINVAASAAALIAAAALLWRRLRSLPRAPRTLRGSLDLLSPAIWAASVVNYSITQLDLWIVGTLGDGRDIALYSAAFRLATLVTTPLIIANFVVSPLVVELLAKEKPKRLQLVAQTVATVAGAPAFVALVVFATFGSWICGLVYGDFYIGAGIPLALLTMGKIANVLTGPCAIALIMSGGQRTNLRILILNLAVTLPMQVVGFRMAGLAGLATATSIGLAMQNIHQVIAVRRHIGILTTFNLPQTLRLIRGLASRDALRDLLLPKRNRGA